MIAWCLPDQFRLRFDFSWGLGIFLFCFMTFFKLKFIIPVALGKTIRWLEDLIEINSFHFNILFLLFWH